MNTNGPLRCDAKDRDRYGRTVSDCWAGEVNVSEAMVRLGWAWALPRYSKDRFLPAQERRSARTAGSGRGMPIAKRRRGFGRSIVDAMLPNRGP